ncbi:MAG: hypothetical protein ACXVD0_03680 [Nocardioides sp.]
MRRLPTDLTSGPFHRDTATRLGVTSRMLEGDRFVRVFPRVYRHRDHAMLEADWVRAATLTMPPTSHLTGITRIQAAGLDFGPRRPLRFVVEGDLHLVPDQIFLHRTKRLPPVDDVGVTPAAAFIAYAARARVIDAMQVGDWLLHEGLATVAEIESVALAALWRDGAHEAIWLLDHLDDRSRSLLETQTRALLVASGLPAPEVNVEVNVGGSRRVITDLLYRAQRTAVEYDGAHHQTDRSQYVTDIDRYAALQAAGVEYVQVTREKIARPRRLVSEVHRTLRARGYAGPPPSFGEAWRHLFLPVSVAVGPRWERAVG